MTSSGGAGKERERHANRIIWWAFLAALIAIPPLNKYVTGPLAGRLLDAPGSMASWILGGAIGGAFFGGVMWLIGRNLTKHQRKGAQS